MSERATYRLLVDWDRDGFWNKNVSTSDPLNLVPNPVTFHGLYVKAATSNSTYDRQREATEYGTYLWEVSTGGDAGGGIAIGQHVTDATLTVIPVTPGSTYTVQVWVKLVSTAGNAALSLKLVNPATGTVAGSANFTPTTDWAAYTVTAAAGATQMYARIDVLKVTTADLTVFDLTGPMLVAGSSAPTVFNAGAYSNAFDDIIDFAESIQATYGIASYTEAVAPASSMTIQVDNVDAVFAPENPPSDRTTGGVQNTVTPVIDEDAVLGVEIEGDDGLWLRPGFFTRGMLIKLEAEYSGTTYPLYIGTLDAVNADVGTFGQRHATLTVVDPIPQLNAAQYHPDLLENVTTDVVLEAVFNSGVIIYPYPADYWLLDVPGASELDVSTVLYENTLTDFDTGDTTLAFAGDTTGSGIMNSAVEFIRETVYGELGGRFFWDAPTAAFKFFSRTRDILYSVTIEAPGVLELDDAPEYVWGDDLMNKVTVTYYPRVVGDVGDTLYTLGNVPMTLTAGQTRTMTVRYQITDAPNATIAGKDMIVPIASTDYTASSNTDGTGDVTSSLVVVCNFHATTADLSFTNGTGSPMYIQTFRLRGTPLISYRAVQTTAFDGASIVAQGEYRRTIDIPALGDANLAESYAGYVTQRYKTPHGRIIAATLRGNRDADTLVNVLAMAVGNHVRIWDAFLNNQTANNLVTGMTHTITAGGSHTLRLNVEPLDRYLYWILDDATLSVLETTTRLNL